MSCFIEDLHRRLKCVGRGGNELHVLMTIYNALLSVSMENLEAKCLRSLRFALSADGHR